MRDGPLFDSRPPSTVSMMDPQMRCLDSPPIPSFCPPFASDVIDTGLYREGPSLELVGSIFFASESGCAHSHNMPFSDNIIKHNHDVCVTSDSDPRALVPSLLYIEGERLFPLVLSFSLLLL